MRHHVCLVTMAAVLLAFATGVCSGAEADAAASVFFPETQYEFSPVLEDSQIVHEFVIQNKGNATLQVQRVKTG